MKKLFSVITMLVLIIGLASCTNTTDLDQQITDLEAQVAALQEIAVTKESEIAGLQAYITELQELLFDNIITFTFTDSMGNMINHTTGYDDDYTGTLFDLLDGNFEVGFSESEYGKYIYSVEDLSPTTGSYISFLKNGEYSMVGVEAATFQDGDVFDFVIAWYDNTEEAVFNSINLFIDELAADYITETSMDYNVVSGLALLGKLDDYVTQAEVITYVDSLTLTTITDYFKAIVLLEAVDADTEELASALNDIVATGPYGQTAYGLIGLDANSRTVDYSVYTTSALLDLNTTTPVTLDLDAGGISLVALSNYTTETGVATLISDFADYVSTNQLPSGGIMTVDNGWGSTENAASMSQAILGLIANGVNPTSAEFTKGTNNLVLRLTQFQLATGVFDWNLLDETDGDATFSTPQAFLALAAYYTFSNNGNVAVNPYNYTE